MRTMLAGLLVAVAGPAAAQDPWSFALSPYVWLPGVSTSTETGRGTIDVDTSPSDAVADLDFAFMGAFEARNGRWGLILDLIYADLSASADTPLGGLWSRAEVDTKLTAFTAYAGYRVFENERGAVDLLGGGRFYSLDLDLTLEPGLLAARSRDFSDDLGRPGARRPRALRLQRQVVHDRTSSMSAASAAARTRAGRPSQASATSSIRAGRCRAAGATWRSRRRSTARTSRSTSTARSSASRCASDVGRLGEAVDPTTRAVTSETMPMTPPWQMRSSSSTRQPFYGRNRFPRPSASDGTRSVDTDPDRPSPGASCPTMRPIRIAM